EGAGEFRRRSAACGAALARVLRAQGHPLRAVLEGEWIGEPARDERAAGRLARDRASGLLCGKRVEADRTIGKRKFLTDARRERAAVSREELNGGKREGANRQKQGQT